MEWTQDPKAFCTPQAQRCCGRLTTTSFFLMALTYDHLHVQQECTLHIDFVLFHFMGIRSEGRTSPRIFFFDLRKRMKRCQQQWIPKSQWATPITNIIYALRTPELTTLGWINILKSEQRDHHNYPGFDGHTSPHFHKSGRHISLQIGKFSLTRQRTFPVLSGCSRTRSHRIFPFFSFRTDCSGPL